MPFTEKTGRFLLYKKANAEFINYSEKRGRGLEDVHVPVFVFETLQPRVHAWHLQYHITEISIGSYRPLCLN